MVGVGGVGGGVPVQFGNVGGPTPQETRKAAAEWARSAQDIMNKPPSLSILESQLETAQERQPTNIGEVNSLIQAINARGNELYYAKNSFLQEHREIETDPQLKDVKDIFDEMTTTVPSKWGPYLQEMSDLSPPAPHPPPGI